MKPKTAFEYLLTYTSLACLRKFTGFVFTDKAEATKWRIHQKASRNAVSHSWFYEVALFILNVFKCKLLQTLNF